MKVEDRRRLGRAGLVCLALGVVLSFVSLTMASDIAADQASSMAGTTPVWLWLLPLSVIALGVVLLVAGSSKSGGKNKVAAKPPAVFPQSPRQV